MVAEAGAQCDVDVALSTRSRPLATIPAEVGKLAREIASPEVQIVLRSTRRRRRVGGHGSIAPRRRRIGALERRHRPDRCSRGKAFRKPRPPLHCLTSARARASLPRTARLLSRRTGEIARATPVCREEPLANSFNFERTTTSSVECRAGACTAYGAAAALIPIDTCGSSTASGSFCMSGTGDFAPGAIARVKDELSHLFVDRPPPVFWTTSRKACGGSPRPDVATRARPARCGRRFASSRDHRCARGGMDCPTSSRPARACARRRLGEQLYRNELDRSSARCRAVHRPHPDEVSLARLRAEFPEGRFHLGAIEDFR